MNEALLVALVGGAWAVAFVLSGMEAGLFALSRFRIRRLAREGNWRAVRLQRYLENPESFLWTIVVGNTLAALVAVAVVARHLELRMSGHPAVFMGGVVGMLLAFHLVADLLPKLLFRRFPTALCLAGVGPFQFLRGLLLPLVVLTESISRSLLNWTGGKAFTGPFFANRAEVRLAIEESAPSLSSEELAMINRILDLQELRVRDVMTPLRRALTLDASERVGALLSKLRERPVSYVPLWNTEEGERRVLGVVSVAKLLYEGEPDPERPLRSLVQPAQYVSESTRLEEALRGIQRGRQRFAVVLNARARECGVVTLNDLLRAMFGKVQL